MSCPGDPCQKLNPNWFSVNCGTPNSYGVYPPCTANLDGGDSCCQCYALGDFPPLPPTLALACCQLDGSAIYDFPSGCLQKPGPPYPASGAGGSSDGLLLAGLAVVVGGFVLWRHQRR